MHLALNLNGQVKDGTLVLTDGVGKTVTFSEAQSVQQQVSMITLGELCGLPKRALATGFGFKSRTSSDDSRNAVLQGTAADLMKIAMVRLHRRIRESGLRARLLIQVHDELVLEVPADRLAAIASAVRDAMEQVFPLRVPLDVDVRPGATWAEAH